ncbi:T9SS type A sorting domain-containing protein [Winogradskyella ursingii]|uniref:T9SS type A sorting domain-containing protein n=1 Tax=Winogradskyella ursingii TaxID=2686079 RepID=UPI0015CECE25|nr:T9SS type A sorting domain-containing protein [Winogradskyella ursingii]
MKNFTLQFSSSIKLLSLCVLLSFCTVTYGQGAIDDTQRTTSLDHPACIYYADEFTESVSIPRDPMVIARMESNRMPCANITVNYNGFTGPAQAAFQFAVDIWANSIDSEIPITVNANFTELDPNVLGSAGPTNFSTTPNAVSNTFYPQALVEKINNAESNPPAPDSPSIDINANFSNQINWYFGTNARPPNNQFDFVSVVLHELGHGLGFVGFGRLDDTNSNLGRIRFSNIPSIYDRFIENAAALSILSFPDPSTELLDQMTGNNLFCNSPLVRAENGNARPKIFAPSTFNPGSSYSHWNSSTFPQGNVNSLMTPSLAPGVANHNPGPVTLRFFEDMGWTICAGALSVDEFGLNNIQVSPNPFTSSISIQFVNVQNDNYKIDLMDINGRVVLSKNQTIENNTITLSNLQKMDDALYFIKITNTASGSSITKKVIKK